MYTAFLKIAAGFARNLQTLLLSSLTYITWLYFKDVYLRLYVINIVTPNDIEPNK